MRKALVSLVALLMALTLPAPSAFAGSDLEADFLSLINEERIAQGLSPLTPYWDLVDDARAHSRLMAGAFDIWHNPELGSVTSDWQALAENVGMGPTVPVLHEAFMESPGHRANILGDYNYAGVGVMVDNSQTIFVTVVFMRGVEGLVQSFTPPFRDDEGSVHEPDITSIYQDGITRGCAPDLYCPSQSVTRGQMAAFLVRSLGMPNGPDAFSDDDGHLFESDINALAAEGIVLGCGSSQFCPDQAVSRGQMAAFLARTLDLVDGADAFSDDGGHLFERQINALAASGISNGCGAGSYCPDSPVSRAEMASFLARAFRR
ncbi:MAG: S-layer homology domain-containing protein [Actinomycetota bacterium]|nr:S-layer homology domain-containing protein [Actinomycetota bacterium]